ncbi:DUF917 domain-containing protein [Clostridium sp. WLY-B-L2]|uniref:DUF917 domain-containing protein n=1 Tax=Clostridium aromativorans TaxID=2836848 RepID=A0ABS8N0N7_9CLOT|nr:DUF917 domain-containing protein [Clostridium aromativorans]MCC9293366.1 DUF917 domain-containing protein [Clostridium aromativorans]
MRKLLYQEVEDILIGCTILSTGGGGDLDKGIKTVKRTFDEGREFKLLAFEEIRDDSYYVNPYYCGSVKPKDEMNSEKNNMETIRAVKKLEDYMGIEFEGIVSIEYGGGNTGQAMATAAIMNKCIVDCDAAGRAVPELQFSTYCIKSKPISPFAIATKYGDSIIVTKVHGDERAEALSRVMAEVTDNEVGMADHPINGMELKRSVVPHALSYAEKVGRARREAEENGVDPIENIIKNTGGYMLFKGKVEKGTTFQIKDGFTIGTISIGGQNQFRGEKFKIWYKNENMISWKNDEIFITCPDLICVLDAEKGYPITNPNCREGDQIAVLGFKSHGIWRSKEGISLLNPRFFGFDVDYVPIEKKVASK